MKEGVIKEVVPSTTTTDMSVGAPKIEEDTTTTTTTTKKKKEKKVKAELKELQEMNEDELERVFKRLPEVC